MAKFNLTRAAMVALIAALTAVGVACLEETPTSFESERQGGASEEARSQRERVPQIGDVVEVGSLDLTVVEVEDYDSSRHNQFNDANVRVQVTATNARGDASDEYNFSPLLAMQLVDSDGIAHDPELGCADCPDEITTVDLVRGGTVRGYVYFAIPAGKGLVELIYEPLFSFNKARIRLR